MLSELRRLEKRVAPSGRVRIEHPRSGTDDLVTALGHAVAALGPAGRPLSPEDICVVGRREPWLGVGGGARREKREWMDEVQESAEHGGAYAKGRRALPDW